jgi:soluble lytic murein transglycosylase-like protein
MSYLGSVVIDAEEMFLVNGIANRLGVSYNDLLRLIEFESGFKPDAKNPYSSARGLIQFTDATIW